MSDEEIHSLFHDPDGYDITSFNVFEQIGKGAYSQVFLAQDKETGVKYAFKIVNLKSLNRYYLTLLRREIDIHRVLAHELIVKFYGYFIHKGMLIMILDLCIDGNLFQFLDKHKRLEDQ